MAPDEGPHVVCLSADILDRSRIQGVAKAVGTKIAFARSADDLESLLTEATSVVFADLNDAKADWLDAIRRVASGGQGRARPEIVGYVPHVDKERAKAGEEAGCTEVVSRAQFFKRLSVALADAAGKR